MIKTLTRVAILALSVLGATQAARAADVNILIVDQEKVLRDSRAGQDMARQAQVLQGAIQQEVTDEQNAILTMQKEVERNAAAYSPAQRQEKIKEVEARKRGYPDFEQRKSQILQLSVGKAQNQIALALKPILSQLIKERNATIMLDRQVVMFAVDGLDVTDEAIKRLNNVITTVKVERYQPPQPVSRPPVAPGKPPIGVVKPN